MSFKVYIPARFGASRLPGKPLLQIAGKAMIQHVYERAQESGAEEVVIATDDERIATAAAGFGAAVCMTAATHLSGTDRIAEAVRLRGEKKQTVIVNLQGDEPLMPSTVIRQVAEIVGEGEEADIGTVCEPLPHATDFNDPNVVKVVRDARQRALYFSRAPIPHDRDNTPYPQRDKALVRRHVGIYAYTVAYLQRFVALPPAPLETAERLEQLRALVDGACILVPDALAPCGMGVDTAADLARLNQHWHQRRA